MRRLDKILSARREPEGASFRLNDGWRARVYMLGDDLARVRLTRNGAGRLDRSWFVAAGGFAPVEGRARDDLTGFSPPPFRFHRRAGPGFFIEAGNLAARVQGAPFRISWRRRGDSRDFAADRAGGAYYFSEKTSALRHFMRRENGDRYYGLGDKTGPLNRAGRRFRLLQMDAMGYDAERSDPLYSHIPFFIVKRAGEDGACGFFYDNPAAAAVDFGAETDNYHEPYRYYECEDGDLDYYVFSGATIAETVRAYAALTGRPLLPPRWALGFSFSAMHHADAPRAQKVISDFAAESLRRKVPPAAIHIGSGWQADRRMRRHVFVWNRARYPKPREMLGGLRAAGIRAVGNIKPFVLRTHPARRECVRRGLLVRDENGRPVEEAFWGGRAAALDFSNPATAAWWRRKVAESLLKTGFDAAWNDNNEFEIWSEDAVCAGFGRPLPARLMRPVLGMLMTRASAEAARELRPHLRPFAISRASAPGVQRWAQTWSGDNRTEWKTLRWNLKAGLNMSLSGLAHFGHDAGGFAGPRPDADMLSRWLELGALLPRFAMNSWNDSGGATLPWQSPATLRAARRALRLRGRLGPYLYSLCHLAAREGEPIVRPTFYDFEADAAAFEECDEFMLGKFILAAPVVLPKAKARRLYLPRGNFARWRNFHSGEKHRAGRVVEVSSAPGVAPLFCPAGAMIPLARAGASAASEILFFPPERGRESEFVLYEDDGESEAWKRGDCAEIRLHSRATGRKAELSVALAGDRPPSFSALAVRIPADERREIKISAPPGVRVKIRAPAGFPL